jgi:hypothetical protein
MMNNFSLIIVRSLTERQMHSCPEKPGTAFKPERIIRISSKGRNRRLTVLIRQRGFFEQP